MSYTVPDDGVDTVDASQQPLQLLDRAVVVGHVLEKLHWNTPIHVFPAE